MSWNVRYFGHGTGGARATDGWMRRIAAAINALQPIPDVIALQEVEDRSWRAGLHGTPQLDRFLGMLNQARPDGGAWRGLYFPAHRYGLGRLAPVYTTGLAVLVGPGIAVAGHNADAPFDITHVRLRPFAPFKQRRIAAHVRLRPPGTERVLDLFNTHLSLPAFLEVGPHRVPERMGFGSNQLEEVRALLSYVVDRAQGHAIVVGDFNSAPHSPVYEHMVGSGLVDGFAAARGLLGDALHAWHTAAFRDRRMHIDHVFSAPELQWAAFDDHQIELGPLRGLSDHAPKVGRISLS